MTLIVILVFLGVFVLIAAVIAASGVGATNQDKQMLQRLDSALATSGKSSAEMADLMVDVRKDDLLSSIPWIDRVLRKAEVTPRLRKLLYQANLKWSVGLFLMMTVGAFAIPAYLVYLRASNIWVGLAVGVGFGSLPLMFVMGKRSKRQRKFEEGLPEALELIVSALRVGHSLNSALGLVTRECPDPIGPEFKVTFDEQNYGLELKTALDNMCSRMPSQDLKIVVTAILIQKESGGNLAEVLENTSAVIRERFRLKRQVMTHTAQGRLTGVVLTCLPIALGCALYFVNPKMMSILWQKPIGLDLLYAAGIMIVIGGLIIRKIVNMDV